MITRRSAASFLAGMPLIGGALAKQASVAMPPNYPPPNGTLAGGAVGQPLSQYPSAPIEPLMPQWRAAALALRDPDILALARSIAFEGHRRVTDIDPDIEIYRSFSRMAKITFQRQRNVERDIAQLATEPSHERGGIFRKLVDKFMWGRS